MKRFLKNFGLEILAGVTVLFAGSLIVIEYLTRTNFILETIGIDYVDTFAIALLLTAATLMKRYITQKNFLKKSWKFLVLITPAILTCLALLIFMRYRDFFYFLEQEDSVFEWLQFFLSVTCGLFSLFIANILKKKEKLLALLFLIAGLGFFFVAGEEISWGQRIFNIETPAEYAELNTQGEITLHNYGPLFGLVYKGYMTIGFLSMIGWVVRGFLFKSIQLSKPVKKFFMTTIPDWYTSLFFLGVFLYNYNKVVLNPGQTGHALWEEPMEILLFTACTIFIIHRYFQLKRHR